MSQRVRKSLRLQVGKQRFGSQGKTFGVKPSILYFFKNIRPLRTVSLKGLCSIPPFAAAVAHFHRGLCCFLLRSDLSACSLLMHYLNGCLTNSNSISEVHQQSEASRIIFISFPACWSSLPTVATQVPETKANENFPLVTVLLLPHALCPLDRSSETLLLQQLAPWRLRCAAPQF